MGIYDWAEKQHKRETQHVRERRGYRSSFYHREFAGYAEQVYVDDKGKRRIERIYAAEYYEPALTRKQQLIHRVLYLLLYGLAVACYVYAALLDIPSNYAVYVVVPVAVSLVTLFMTLMALGSYLPLGRLKLPQMNKGPKRLRWVPLLSAASLSLASLATASFLILYTVDSKTLIAAFLFLVSAAAMLALGLIERRVSYQVIPNEVDIDNSVIIR